VQVQALATSVQAGGVARYAIWVWFVPPATGNPQAIGDVTVGLTAQPGKLSPSFTVCPELGTATCLVSAGGTPIELQGKIPVPKNDAGTRLTLTATGSSPLIAVPVPASDNTVVVAPKPTPTPTPARSTPAPTATTPVLGGVGVGVTLPPGTLPPGTLPAAALPSASLPALPNPAASPGVTFPAVSPLPDPTPAPSVHPIRLAEVSAQFPLDTRLIGGQILGLAVLAAAITIAVARFSLRKQRPQQGKDPS
jgi:hypothetical protein